MIKIKFIIFFLLIIFHQKSFAVENKIILKIDNESLKLCLATNLTDTDQTIVSKKLKEWRKNELPNLSKKLCVFLIN